MESGHNKNVANFETVIIILTNLGADYAPPQALIVLTALQELLTDAKAVLADIDTAQAAKTVAVDTAQAEFKDLQQYVVNIKRSAEVEVNDEAFTKDIQTIVNKFHPPGRQTGIDDAPDTPEDESRTPQSQSQQSRDNQIAYLADLSSLLKTNADYNATGTPYATTAIDARIATLTAVNNAVTTTEAALGTKLDARDDVLYTDKTGITDRFILIKKYVLLTFGKDSAVYQQLNALEFRKY
jgi:hypothetical protein